MRLTTLTLLSFLVLVPSLEAALDTYLRISGLEGESSTDSYEGWIDLRGVALGGSNTVSFGSSIPTSGKYAASAIELEMLLSNALPYISDAVANGQLKTVEIDIVRQGAESDSVFTQHVFNDAVFSSAELTGNDSGDQPIVSTIFAYSSMSWSVISFAPDGSPIQETTIEHDALNNTVNLTTGTPTGGGGGGGSSDNDTDDLPNTWETQYGLNPNSSADRDTDLDGDGFSNYTEYLAGTIPNNPTSYLKVSQFAFNGGVSSVLEWSSVIGKSYNIQRAYSDIGNESSWITLGTVTATSGAASSFTLPTTTQSKAFYRVQLKTD